MTQEEATEKAKKLICENEAIVSDFYNILVNELADRIMKEANKPEVKEADWIYRPIGYPEWDKKFEEVEKALGFKLFVWQKYYIASGNYRLSGRTTADILRSLINFDETYGPLDYRRPPADRCEQFYRDETFKMKEKLDKAGIKTREVIWR